VYTRRVRQQRQRFRQIRRFAIEIDRPRRQTLEPARRPPPGEDSLSLAPTPIRVSRRN
jgi:hypothetical protein